MSNAMGREKHQGGSMKILYLLTLMLVAVAASACNTTRGVGQDVEAAGDAIEDTANDAMDDEN
jgi:predicted small secreted protein